MSEIRSPLTGGQTRKTGSISAEEIMAGYRAQYGLDVSEIFGSQNEVSVCKCLDSGYEFYHPLSLSGNESFYDQLSAADWYYDKERWEFGTAMEFIPAGSKVLEIGAGRGAFLDLLKRKGLADLHALEFNPSALGSLREKKY